MEMSKKKYVEELEIKSISYVHDPDAMKRWMDLYVDLLKEELENELAIHRPSSHTI